MVTRIRVPMAMMPRRRSRRSSASHSTTPAPANVNAWAAAEDDLLREGIKRFGSKRWSEIASTQFPNKRRSMAACRHRWSELTLKGIAAEKRKWSPDEDAQLHVLVAKYDRENWSLVASQLPGRNAKQCRERWQNQVRPDLNHDEWTLAEDAVIVTRQAMYGNRWATIAAYLPGRTDNMVKNRWYSTLLRTKDSISARVLKEAAVVKPKRARKKTSRGTSTKSVTAMPRMKAEVETTDRTSQSPTVMSMQHGGERERGGGGGGQRQSGRLLAKRIAFMEVTTTSEAAWTGPGYIKREEGTESTYPHTEDGSVEAVEGVSSAVGDADVGGNDWVPDSLLFECSTESVDPLAWSEVDLRGGGNVSDLDILVDDTELPTGQEWEGVDS